MSPRKLSFSKQHGIADGAGASWCYTIHVGALAVKCKANMKSSKKCGVSNAYDGTEGNVVFEESQSTTVKE